PSTQNRSSARGARAWASHRRSGLLGALISVAAMLSITTVATAETSPKPQVQTATTPLPVVRGQRRVPAPLIPQSRFTVRKQIESIEPTRWLARYGKVRVRKMTR
ncbi:MAG: hypothetical protein NZ808_03610, partial [Myxococcota bacterium]|nr:hypothetical protein [Myxococcota bacterium]